MVRKYFRAVGVVKCKMLPQKIRCFQKIPAKVILDGLKRNMSRGNSLSDQLDLSSVLGDTRAYLYSPVLG